MQNGIGVEPDVIRKEKSGLFWNMRTASVIITGAIALALQSSCTAPPTGRSSRPPSNLAASDPSNGSRNSGGDSPGAYPVSPSPVPADQYLVSPKDELRITIVGEYEKDLPTTFEVNERDGTVKYPFVEYVKVAGLTVTQIEKLLTNLLEGVDREKIKKLIGDFAHEADRGRIERLTTNVLCVANPAGAVEVKELLKDLPAGSDPKGVEKLVKELTGLLQNPAPEDCWFVHPQVNVMVSKYSEKVFTVTGHVKNAGQFSFTGENKMTVFRAIGKAGGFDRIARWRVILHTTDEEGNPKKVDVDVKKIKKNPALDPPIKANDMIIVEESPW